jgi:hypothetical protein
MNEANITNSCPETIRKNHLEIITIDDQKFVFKENKKKTTIESHKTAQAASYIAGLLQLENIVVQYTKHELEKNNQQICGTISKFIESDDDHKIVKIEDLNWDHISDENKNKLLRDLKKIAIYDYIIANTDRNTNNLLIDIKNFQIYAIDQDECFDNFKSAKMKNIEKIINNQIISYIDIKDDAIVKTYQSQEIEIKRDFIDKIMKIFTDKKSIQENLINYGISRQEINKMFARIENVLESISSKAIYQTKLNFR